MARSGRGWLSTPRELESCKAGSRRGPGPRSKARPITPLAKASRVAVQYREKVQKCPVIGGAQTEVDDPCRSATWKRRGRGDAVEQRRLRSPSSTPGRGPRGARTGRRGGPGRGGRRPRRAAGSAARRGARRPARHGRGRGRAAAPSARRSSERAAGWALARWVTARSWRCGPSVARPAAASRPRLARKRSGEVACRPSRRARCRRAGNRRRAWPASASASAATVRARAAASAAPCSAIRASSAASQRDRRRRARRAICCARASPLRSARAWWAWPGSSASTSRSRKRRRSPALSVNSRSIAGVSHSTDSHSDERIDRRRRRR